MSPLDVGLPRARPNERTLAQVERDCLYWAFLRDPDRFWDCVIGGVDAAEERAHVSTCPAAGCCVNRSDGKPEPPARHCAARECECQCEVES